MNNYHVGQPTETDLDFELADAQRRWAGLDGTDDNYVPDGPDDNLDESADDESALAFACPRCGESRLDHLVIVEDDEIECATCGESYTIE